MMDPGNAGRNFIWKDKLRAMQMGVGGAFLDTYLYLLPPETSRVGVERCAYLRRNPTKEPAGSAAFTLPNELNWWVHHTQLCSGSQRAFITQSLLAWQEVGISDLPAEAQDPL